MNLNKSLLIFLISFSFFYSCNSIEKGPLPIIGRDTIVNGDTLKHRIRDFSFLNQDSIMITNTALQEHIYLADFFFTSCPTICPTVAKQMLRIHDKYLENDLIKLVSYTIDPKRDDVKKLKTYSQNLNVSSKKWHFLTGNKDSLLDIADDYFVSAYEDPDIPGGFDHSGKIILIDKNRHVRGFAEGTDPEEVSEFFNTIDQLIKECTNEK